MDVKKNTDNRLPATLYDLASGIIRFIESTENIEQSNIDKKNIRDLKEKGRETNEVK